MKLLDDALERVRQAVLDNPDAGRYTLSRDRLHDYTKVRGHDLPGDECVARLRLDFELASDQEDVYSDVLPSLMKGDLEDLIVNGDVYTRTDALLKSINGEVKRGKKAVEVDIFEISFYKEYKPRRNVTEYTVFLLMYLRFE